MGGGTIYEALAKLEQKHPGAVAIPSSNATAVSRSANREPGKAAKVAVSYAPVVHSAKTEAAKATPRPVVSIKRAAAGTADVVTKVPTLLRHSMNDYLTQSAGEASRSQARARHAG